MYINNVSENKIIHYVYDSSGKVINISDVNKGNYISYEYDKDDNIISKQYVQSNTDQKLTYNLFNHDHNKSKEQIISGFVNKYDCEIIYKDNQDEGLFGLKKINNDNISIVKDQDIGMYVMAFEQNSKYLSYDLFTWNMKKTNRKYNEFRYNKNITLHTTFCQ